MATNMVLGAVLALAGALTDSPSQSGKALYETHCGVCHQADGWGVPFMQPALVDSPRVLEGPDTLLEMVFKGSAALPEGTSEYDNEMPNFEWLKDEDIALIATYIRQQLAGQSEPVSVSRVKSARQRFSEGGGD